MNIYIEKGISKLFLSLQHDIGTRRKGFSLWLTSSGLYLVVRGVLGKVI